MHNRRAVVLVQTPADGKTFLIGIMLLRMTSFNTSKAYCSITELRAPQASINMISCMFISDAGHVHTNLLCSYMPGARSAQSKATNFPCTSHLFCILLPFHPPVCHHPSSFLAITAGRRPPCVGQPSKWKAPGHEAAPGSMIPTHPPSGLH